MINTMSEEELIPYRKQLHKNIQKIQKKFQQKAKLDTDQNFYLPRIDNFSSSQDLASQQKKIKYNLSNLEGMKTPKGEQKIAQNNRQKLQKGPTSSSPKSYKKKIQLDQSLNIQLETVNSGGEIGSNREEIISEKNVILKELDQEKSIILEENSSQLVPNSGKKKIKSKRANSKNQQMYSREELMKQKMKIYTQQQQLNQIYGKNSIQGSPKSTFISKKPTFHRYYNADQVENQYPKLIKYVESSNLSNQQQKALKEIVHTKPQLAASLDLYASKSLQTLINKQQQTHYCQLQQITQKQQQQQQQQQQLQQQNQIIPLNQGGTSNIILPNKGLHKVKKAPQTEMDFSMKKGKEVLRKQKNQYFEMEKIQNQREKIYGNSSQLMKVDGNKPIMSVKKKPIAKKIQNWGNMTIDYNIQYKYYIGKGNNSQLVRMVMETRNQWKEVPSYYNIIHFNWQPLSKRINFSSLNQNMHQKRMVNHFENHQVLTTKSGLLQNLQDYFQQTQIKVPNQTYKNAFQVTPITFFINLADQNNWDKNLETFLDYYLQNVPPKPPSQKNTITINRKCKTVSVKKQKNGQNSIQSDQKMENVFKRDDGKYVWVLKPVNLNRGRGIEFFSSLEELEKFLNEYYEGFQEKNFYQIGMQQQQEKEELLKEQQQEQNEKQQLEQEQGDQQQQQEQEQQEDQNQTLELNKSVDIPVSNENQNLNDIEHLNLSKSQEITPSNKNNINKIETKNTLEQNPAQNSINILEGDAILNASPEPKKEQKDKQQQQQQQQKQSVKQSEQELKDSKILSIEQSQINLNISKKVSQSSKFHSKKGSTTSNNWKYVLRESQFVIQKYLERPLCVNQRKFDIRVWVLLTQNMDLYVFKEGYLRTSSENFTLDDIQNPFIHLTNNAVQKFGKNYGNSESGNQLSYKEFQRYLDQNFAEKQVKVKDLVKKMDEQILISFLSVRNKLNPSERKGCIEIYGFDFIIDEEFGVWLIEVNTNPCIETSSPMLAQYLPRMLDDAFKLTLDKMFLTKNQAAQNNNTNQNLDNNSTNNNINNINNKLNVNKIVGQNVMSNSSTVQKKEENGGVSVQKEQMFQTQREVFSQSVQEENRSVGQNDKQISQSSKELDVVEQNNEQEIKKQDNNNQNNQNNNSKQCFKVDGYSDGENMWDFKLNIKTLKKAEFDYGQGQNQNQNMSNNQQNQINNTSSIPQQQQQEKQQEQEIQQQQQPQQQQKQQQQEKQQQEKQEEEKQN